MTRHSFKEKIAAVASYMQKRRPLRSIARHHGISRTTLWHWLRRYRERGADGLKGSTVKTRRIPHDLEMTVMMLKEQCPGISVRKARMALNQSGARISIFGIWRIWKDHGLIKNKRDDPLDTFIPTTPDLERTMDMVRQHVEHKEYRPAANIINRLPGMPRSSIISRIPYRYLSSRRKLDLICLERRDGAYEHLAIRARRTGAILQKKGYRYSSIIADFYELDALDIMGQPEKKAKVLLRLSGKMQGIRSYPLQFLFRFEQAYTSVYRLKVTEALGHIEQCRRYVHLLPHPHYWELFGALLVLVGKFNNARGFYEKALVKTVDRNIAARLTVQMARYAHCYAGDYPGCRKMLAGMDKKQPEPALDSAYNLTYAYLHFGEGDLVEAARHFVRSLETASRGKHTNRIYAASVGLAGVARALNQKNQARNYLRKYLPLIKKNRLLREGLLLECFLDPATVIPSELLRISPLNLLNRLQRAHRSGKVVDYRAAFRFAESQGMTGLFHRWMVFFPESAARLMEKGKRTGLPKSVLNFPVFNQAIPVFHVWLLGDCTVIRNGIKLKSRLSPKEKALLIHLALRIEAPGKSIAVDRLLHNFWPRSPDGARLLSHILVTLKKKLRLASHRLRITAGAGTSWLVNNGVYFTTDHTELRSLLTQARTLELSGEWHFARREYRRAFALCRGALFDKMYDEWSEETRRSIMNYLETEALRFARMCVARGNKKDAARVLDAALQAMPGSAELNELRTSTGGLA